MCGGDHGVSGRDLHPGGQDEHIAQSNEGAGAVLILREGGREGEREREGGREGGREEEREGGREGGRTCTMYSTCKSTQLHIRDSSDKARQHNTTS